MLIRFRLPALAVAAGCLILLGWFGLSYDQHRREQRARESQTGVLAQGGALYAAHCAACHGSDLSGQPNWRQRAPNGRLPAPPHDATGHTWHHSDKQLFEITKHGMAGLVPGYQSDMPPFADVLGDQEINAVLLFIKSTWPAEIQSRQEAISGRSRR